MTVSGSIAVRVASSANHPASCPTVRRDSVTSGPDNRPVAGSKVTDILVHPPRAVRSAADVESSFQAGALAILWTDVFIKTRDCGIADQAHRAAPKSRTGHSRAVYAVDFPRETHHDIQFFAAYLIVVAERIVRCIHQ